MTMVRLRGKVAVKEGTGDDGKPYKRFTQTMAVLDHEGETVWLGKQNVEDEVGMPNGYYRLGEGCYSQGQYPGQVKIESNAVAQFAEWMGATWEEATGKKPVQPPKTGLNVAAE